MTTPVGEGIRSINVNLRQVLDLYACVRPVKYIPGIPSPMKQPELVDMIVDGKVPQGKIIIRDRIADAMIQQILMRPAEYDVLAMPNLNGDYMSDALAAMVGGLGMAPGANIGDGYALFEATHGTAPKYAGQDKVNPGSLILSGAMMLDYLGWNEAAESVRNSLLKTVDQKIVTYDLARQMEGVTEVKCSEFDRAMVANM